jgi:hypothetical protein
MEYGEWLPLPDPLEVRVAPPMTTESGITCAAVIDLSILVPTVPEVIYDQLGLPDWCSFEFVDHSTAMSVRPSNDSFVHVTLGLLAALDLQYNRDTEELRSFTPFLYSPILEG